MRNTKNIFPGMGKDGLLMFFVITAFIFFLPPAHSYSSILDSLYIRHIDGDVQIKTEDTEDWVPAAINMPLSEGGRVWGPDAARVELQLKDGTYLRMNENSSLDILTLDKNSFQFYLGTGQAFVNFMGLKGSVLQIDTPVSSVVAYDKAYFRIDLSANGQMQVSVFKGIVYAENKNDRIKVDSKNTLTLRDNRTELAGLGPVDDWEDGTGTGTLNSLSTRDPLNICPKNSGLIPMTLRRTEGGSHQVITATFGPRMLLYQPTGPHTLSADGHGSAEIMSGYHMNHGDGPPIITADGFLSRP